MRPRVLFAGLFHETHTFTEDRTRWADFAVRSGKDLLHGAGDSSPMGGALERARALGWEVVPALDVRAAPSGVVDDAVTARFWEELQSVAEASSSSGPLSALYLVLHGAMVTASELDVEGALLRRLRADPKMQHLPVVAVCDLHANVSEAMWTSLDALVAYRENPHTDARSAAIRAVDLLHRILESGERPRLVGRQLPILWPPAGTGTSDWPMRGLQAMARDLEERLPEFWAVNVTPGFSFADTPDTGLTVTIVTAGDAVRAHEAMDQLARCAWENRQRGWTSLEPVDSVVQELRSPPPGLTVLVEPSDNIGAGAPGDGTGLLRALVRHGVPNAAVALWDPSAVLALRSVPLGGRVTLPLGGRGSALDEGPLVLQVELIARNSGEFALEDPQSHLASLSGDRFDMGDCAVVRHREVTILLTSRRTPPFDLGQWRSQGIQPEALSVVGVKAAVAHRRVYDPIAARMIWVETPGACTNAVERIPYRNLRRPIFPLDAAATALGRDIA